MDARLLSGFEPGDERSGPRSGDRFAVFLLCVTLGILVHTGFCGADPASGEGGPAPVEEVVGRGWHQH